jgi:hypothetical protein
LFILQFRRIFFININISFIHYFWGHWHVNRSMLLRNINWSLGQLTIIFVKKLNILDSAKIWSVLMLIYCSIIVIIINLDSLLKVNVFLGISVRIVMDYSVLNHTLMKLCLSWLLKIHCLRFKV